MPIYEFHIEGKYLSKSTSVIKSQIEGTFEIPGTWKWTPPRLRDYRALLGEAVLYLGLLGLLMFFWKISRMAMFYQRSIKDGTSYAIILLIAWIFMFFLFSRFCILGDSQRRILFDLGLPLSICAGIFLFTILKHTYLFFMSWEYPLFVKALIKKIPLKGIYMIAILLILLCSGWHTSFYLQEHRKYYVYATNLDYDAGEWAKNNIPEDEIILTGNYAAYLFLYLRIENLYCVSTMVIYPTHMLYPTPIKNIMKMQAMPI